MRLVRQSGRPHSTGRLTMCKACKVGGTVMHMASHRPHLREVMVHRGATWLLISDWHKLRRSAVRAVMADSSCVA